MWQTLLDRLDSSTSLEAFMWLGLIHLLLILLQLFRLEHRLREIDDNITRLITTVSLHGRD